MCIHRTQLLTRGVESLPRVLAYSNNNTVMCKHAWTRPVEDVVSGCDLVMSTLVDIKRCYDPPSDLACDIHLCVWLLDSALLLRDGLPSRDLPPYEKSSSDDPELLGRLRLQLVVSEFLLITRSE